MFTTACALLFLILGSRAEGADLSPRNPRLISAPLAEDPLQVTIHRLDNGLTVYLSPNHQEPRIAAWIPVRAGAKHDPADSTGMAHYLEHMLFKGSQSFGTLDYEKEKPHLDRILVLYEKLFETKDPETRKEIYAEIDRENVEASKYAVTNELSNVYGQMGFSGLNAFTGPEYVTYICTLPANRARAWAETEAERFAHPVFRLFQTEIETVYEERNMGEDSPYSVINKALGKKLFKKHPYGQHTIVGSMEHLKNPSLKKMYEFYDKYYVPNNMAICLAGDFDRREMLDLVREQFSGWKPKELPPEPKWDLPEPDGVERVEVKYEAEEEVRIAWLLPGNRHPDFYALRMMDMLLSNGTTGIIDITLNQAQKVKSAGSFAMLLNDAGSLELLAVPKKGKTLEQTEELLLGCVENLKAGEFTRDDMSAVVTAFEVSEKRGAESNTNRVSQMADSFQQFKEWEEAAGLVERLRAVTKRDVLRVARKYIGRDRVVAYRRNGKPDIPKIPKPEFTKVEVDPSRRSDFMGEVLKVPVTPLEPKWVKEGEDYTVAEYPWGKFYASKNPMNDLFFIHFGFYFGYMHDRRIGQALSLLALSGAGDLSTKEFKRKLYGLGTSISFGSAERWVWIQVDGINKNMEESLKLLFAHFNSPNVPEGALEKMVQVELGAREDAKRNPYTIRYALGEYAQRGKESEMLASLTNDELKGLTEKELVGLIKGLFDFKRHSVYLGNRPPAEVAKLYVDGRGEYRDPPPSKTIQYVKPDKHRVLFVHRDMIQSQVGIFGPDEIFDPASWTDYGFYANYIGGGMDGLIFQEVREARALAYSAGGGYGAGHWAGDQNFLSGSVTTQADKTIEATALLRSLLQDPPLSEKRFRRTSASIEESYRTQRLGFRSVAFEVMRWRERGLPPGDPRPAWFEKARDYRMADMEKFGKRFENFPMTIYILGNRDRVDMEALKNLGEFTEITLDDIFPY